MSTTIDNKVVEMQFDNRQFEKNVQTSMSTLEKLKQCLNLTGAAKGFEDINSAARNVNMSGLGSAVETVQAKFSAMQVMAVTALANITNSAVNAGKRIVSALTIDPIKTGFQEYETQINSVQTILANTESKGSTLTDVNKALDTLNAYADQTIYNFTEMTRNIGTFTAAGVDLDTSVKSIQGIANLAAVSGSTSQQASTAMYQLSQALAAGKVSLMDWNSVVNAGMGGQVFQDALKRTSEVLGTGAEDAIKQFGSFRESLTQGEWLTTEVLTKTLEQFTMAAEEGSDEWNNFKKSLMDDGYTEKQAEEILKMANTATNAATKVKTFTQLWDTLKEAAQSGWTQTWEILVGDFEEAKSMLTNVSNVINEMIGKSAQARNELLLGWKEAGGRDDLLEGFKSIFNGLMAIVTPIKEAFRDIFPPATSDQLLKISGGFKDLAKIFENFADKHGEQIYSTFKGIFSVLKLGWDTLRKIGGAFVGLISHFTGIGGGLLGITGAFGDFLTNMSESIEKADILGKSIEWLSGFFGGAIDKVKGFGESLKENFQSKGFQNFTDVLKGVWDLIKSISAGLAKVLAPIGTTIASLFENANLFDVLSTGLLAGSFVGIKKLAGGITEIFENTLGEGGFLDNVKGVLDDVRGCFESYQNNLNAGTLTKIATAIGILAASIFVISSIDPSALDRSLGAMGVLFMELLASLKLFTMLNPKTLKGTMQAVPLMIGMAAAISILAGAMKKLASIDWEGIGKGLVGVGVLMGELSIFLRTFKFDGKLAGTAVGLVILSSALLILSQVVEQFAGMDWSGLSKGLAGIGGLLLELSIFTKFTSGAKHMMSVGASMLMIGASMKIFASVMKDFSGMDWEGIKKGLAAMGGVLLELTIAMKLMPKNTLGMGVGLIAVAASMKILASSLSDFGGMSWSEIGKGLVVMGGALAELAIALNLMNGTLAGSAALIIAVGALALLTPVLKTLGGMSWEGIAKSMAAIGGALLIIGVAGLALSPVIPAILSLAGAMAVFSLSMLGIGAGLALVGVGITAIAAALATGATAIVAGLSVIITGIINLIPAIIEGFGTAIKALCTVIMDCAPLLAETILVVVSEVFKSLATYTPQIVDSLLTFLIGVMDAVAARLPELITSAVNLIGQFFQGIVDALSGLDTTGLIQGIAGVGFLAALMFALSAITGLIPGAMAGVIGMGVVIAELALVLAAIGALAQIPGLSWLIEEGGDFLQKIGTAIGQFVGGIVGGIAEGATSTLPQVGTNLSDFMTNLQPFLDGARTMDASVAEGVKSLATAILALTGANLIEGLTAWLTGGSSLADFGAQLAAFGPYMAQYAASVAGIDTAAIVASAAAAKALVQVAQAIPNDGGVASWFAGENNIGDFAKNLIPFGEGMKSYASAVAGIDAASIAASATGAKALVQVAESIPNEGGVASWFAGDNDLGKFAKKLVPFGEGMKSYSSSVSGINTAAISASVMGARQIISLVNSMAGIDTSGVGPFTNAMAKLGKTSIDGFVNAFSGASAKLKNVGSNIFTSISNGMKSKQSILSTTMTTAIGLMITAANSRKAEFISSGTTLMTLFIAGIKSQTPQMTGAMTVPLSAALATIRGYYTSFYSAGAYISSGLAAGMTSKLYAVRKAAKEISDLAAKAARDALKIKSPSRVFYAIGKFVVEGFTNALHDGGRSAYKAASGMADSAKVGFNKALGKITDVLNGEIDANPTITPILDLSDVRTGVDAISNMFGNKSFDVMSNVRAVSSMMSGYNQNGGTEDIVYAINKLRNELGNVGNTSYTFGNITYDDGSVVSGAVETLVRAAKMERRM
jgi:tape measure domain-containing protein